MPSRVVRKRGSVTDVWMFSSIVRILTSGWLGSIARTTSRRAVTADRGSFAVRSTSETKFTGSTVSACRIGK